MFATDPVPIGEWTRIIEIRNADDLNSKSNKSAAADLAAIMATHDMIIRQAEGSILMNCEVPHADVGLARSLGCTSASMRIPKGDRPMG